MMSSKRKRKNSALKAIFIILAMIVLVIFGIVFAFISRKPRQLDETILLPEGNLMLTVEVGCLEWWGGNESHEAIELAAGIELPNSVSDIQASSIAFMDCSINLRFSMAASELDSFLVSTYVGELRPIKGSDLSRIFRPNHNVDWVFDEDAIYLYAQGHREMEFQDIVIDNRKPERLIIYVITELL